MKYTLILYGVRIPVQVGEGFASLLLNKGEEVKFQFEGKSYKVSAVITRFGRVNFTAEEVVSNKDELSKILRVV
jgi:hypothetical protein